MSRKICMNFSLPNLSLAPIWQGEGYSPSDFFRATSRSYKRIVVKFSANYRWSIWHILTKGLIEVRVACYFFSFGKKIRICGKCCPQPIFKTELIAFQQKMENECVGQTAILDVWNFKNFENWGKLTKKYFQQFSGKIFKIKIYMSEHWLS